MRQCRCNVLIHIKVNFEKKDAVHPIEKFPFLVLAMNTIMLQHHFSLYCLSCCRLREVKIKGKSQNFSCKSGRGRLQELPKVVIWRESFGILENWSQRRGGRKRRLDCKFILRFVEKLHCGRCRENLLASLKTIKYRSSDDSILKSLTWHYIIPCLLFLEFFWIFSRLPFVIFSVIDSSSFTPLAFLFREQLQIL